MEAVFKRKRTVSGDDVDRLGHVNNVVWLGWVIDLAHAHSEAVGLDLEEDIAGGHAWVVRRHEIDYHRPAGAGAEIIEETWVSQMRGARLWREVRFLSADDGALLVAARTLWAWVDLKAMRPRRVPNHVVERFAILALAES